MKFRRNGAWNMTAVLLGCFFLVAVILPLLRLFAGCLQADFSKIFANPLVPKGIANSIQVSLCATGVSVALALLLAWCMNRTKVRGKWLFQSLLLLPMLIPSISHGMGLVILFGANGKLTNLLGLSGGIYGFWGILLGSVMYSFPVAYLMLADVLKYEDATPYEAAAVLGLSRWHTFTAITLPFLRKPLVNVIFATFTMIVTDYGVPLMIGGAYKTLPVIMYEEVIGRLDFAQGSVFGLLLLLPAVAAFVIDMLCRSRTGSGYASRPFELKPAFWRDCAAFAVLGAVSLAVVYPLFSFVQLTFASRYPKDMSFTWHNISSTLNKGALDYLENSVQIALVVALLGTAAAFLCAYLTVRLPMRGARFLHLMSITSLAVPGIVLGLAYVMFFKGSFIYGTMSILILVNTIHFLSSPYLMMYNSLGKLNPNLEAVGATLGVGRLRLIKDVILPQTKATLLEMFAYFFVNSMMTISAVAFLANAKTKPVSLMINQFEAQTLLEAAAFVSLLILLVNLALKGLIFAVKNLLQGRNRRKANEQTI